MAGCGAWYILYRHSAESDDAASQVVTAEASSMLLGTLGLSVAALAALLLSLSRTAIRSDCVRSIQLMAWFAVGLHLLHFSEEYLNDFYLQFPELLGLAVWPESFFITFNLAWLAIWVAAIASLEKAPRAAVFPLWFLGLASAANGLAHPVLALAVGAYFPGLWSSPLAGIAGILLLRRLALATSWNKG
jgi:Protein of unknown function with HXXEE motif